MVGSDFSSMLVYFTGDAITTGGLVLHLDNGFVHLFKKWQFVELCPNLFMRNNIDCIRFDSGVTIEYFREMFLPMI